MLNIATPGIDKMIEWHQRFMNKQFLLNGKLNKELIPETGAPSKYGLDTIEKILGDNIYRPLKPAL
jgi:hypothetical protein